MFHSYLCEITPLSGRARVTAFLNTIGISGGIFAGAVAISVIPLTGQSIVIENKEHFSAWHRYLLLTTIIPIISTILMCWLPESPRYLLANGNEVEALATYQVRKSVQRLNNSIDLFVPFSRSKFTKQIVRVVATHWPNWNCQVFVVAVWVHRRRWLRRW